MQLSSGTNPEQHPGRCRRERVPGAAQLLPREHPLLLWPHHLSHFLHGPPSTPDEQARNKQPVTLTRLFVTIVSTFLVMLGFELHYIFWFSIKIK